MRRSSVVLFVLFVALSATLASAQTVIVRHAIPGSTLELVVDGKQAGTAKVNTSGNGTVTTNSVDGQIDTNIWLDACDDAHRVMLMRPGASLMPADGCRRTQIPGLYLLQRITSIVIDTNNTASVLIRQGRAYDVWLTDARPQVAKTSAATETQSAGASPAGLPAASEPPLPLTGLTVFGGAGRGTALNFESQSCGTLDCTRDVPMQYGGGVAWWLSDFFGVEARYGYLGTLTVAGAASDYRFSSTREGGFLAFAGRAGFRKGRFRPFGRAGLSLGRATVTTKQTIGESTQTLEMRARGWAPVFGGGVEIWLRPRLGLYVDGQSLGLKGKHEGDSGIKVDDTLFTALAGLAVRF